MKIRYCLPIIKDKKEEVFKMIKTNIKDYDFFEVWLDYVNGVDEVFIKELIKLSGGKLIFLFRRQNLEEIKMDFKKRFEIISILNSSKSLIDFDKSQERELDYIKKNKLKIKKIVSYHNYNKTPENEKLREIIGTISKYHPEFIKVSTMCNSKQDALRLLNLLLELKKRKSKCVILGMGEFGVITRVYGSLWGNEMAFAPKTVDGQSAEAQLTKEEMEKMFEILNSNSKFKNQT